MKTMSRKNISQLEVFFTTLNKCSRCADKLPMILLMGKINQNLREAQIFYMLQLSIFTVHSMGQILFPLQLLHVNPIRTGNSYNHYNNRSPIEFSGMHTILNILGNIVLNNTFLFRFCM